MRLASGDWVDESARILFHQNGGYSKLKMLEMRGDYLEGRGDIDVPIILIPFGYSEIGTGLLKSYVKKTGEINIRMPEERQYFFRPEG
jgi:hypothetical protein